MSNIVARRENLLEEAEQVYREQFKISIRNLEETYKSKEYQKSVTDAIAKAAYDWNKTQDRPAASLGICILHSSILRQTYEYRIVVMGEEFWLDENAVELMWIPKGFPDFFEQDMSALVKKLSSIFPRLCKEEETAVRFRCAEYFHGAVYKLCRDFLEDILESEEFLQLKKTEDFFLFFGEYRGEGKLLYSLTETDEITGREDIWNISH